MIRCCDLAPFSPCHCTSTDLDFQYLHVPCKWRPVRTFTPKRSWSGAPATPVDPCPCNWQAKPAHLTKCNWWKCGPSPRGTDSDGYVSIHRNKSPNEMVSDYQSYVSVGGAPMWMNLDTGTSCSWVMSKACFLDGCLETEVSRLGRQAPSRC